VNLVVGALVCYALLVAVAYLLQRQMLYFPQTTTQSQMAQAASRLGLVLWPDEDGEAYGLVSATSPTSPKGTILVWHGNAGTALHRAYYIQPLQELGYRVILVEYPGYGARPGKPSEAAFVADALQAARRAQEDFGGPLYAWGESLGCGVASAVAAAAAAGPELDVRGAVMLTPWDDLPSLAQRHYWYLPARWLARDKYDNVKNLRVFPGPVALLMAERDEVIPNAHTKRLYDSLPDPKRLWVFQDVGHNTWPTSPNEAWWAEVMNWLTR
jgi:alpha-beta hydrolase superfamily lysophospholipase